MDQIQSVLHISRSEFDSEFNGDIDIKAGIRRHGHPLLCGGVRYNLRYFHMIHSEDRPSTRAEKAKCPELVAKVSDED